MKNIDDKMIEKALWKQHTITTKAYSLAKLAWVVASIDVLLDDEPILKTGGQFRFRGSCLETFTDEDETHVVELSYGMSFWGTSFPYSVKIDDKEVANGRVKVENWYLIWWLLSLTLLACILLLLCIV